MGTYIAEVDVAEQRRSSGGADRRGSGGSGRPAKRTERAPARGPKSGPRSGGKPGGDRREGGSGGPSRRDGGPGGRRGAGAGKRRDGAPAGRRDGAFGRREEEQVERTVDQKTYDGPPIPDGITGKELDRSVMAQLRSLPEKLALRVARHLVAAGLIMEDDPKTAYEHTLAAKARAGRLAIVREAVGEAAYAAGEYEIALSELRAARRMSGRQDHVAVIADCERAIGRPKKAIDFLKGIDLKGLDRELVAEILIVAAGARRDLGQIDAAIAVLEGGPLQAKTTEAWLPRLRYAYADALAEAGRKSDAAEWFHRTVAVDSHSITDADERAAALED